MLVTSNCQYMSENVDTRNNTKYIKKDYSLLEMKCSKKININ